MAIAERYPLPSWGLDGAPWTEEASYLNHRRLMLNGLGFGRVLLAGKLEDRTLAKLEENFTGDDLAAALHGVGRVLWFLHLGNPEPLGELLRQHPRYAERLAIGVGTAICFTQVTQMNDVLTTLAQLPQAVQPALHSGMGIALRFHAANDPEAEAAIEGSLTAQTNAWYEAARQASLKTPGHEPSLDWHYQPLSVL